MDGIDSDDRGRAGSSSGAATSNRFGGGKNRKVSDMPHLLGYSLCPHADRIRLHHRCHAVHLHGLFVKLLGIGNGAIAKTVSLSMGKNQNQRVTEGKGPADPRKPSGMQPAGKYKPIPLFKGCKNC